MANPKIVNSWSQIAPPTPAKPVKVPPVPGLNHRDGGPVQLFARKLTSWDLDEYQASLRDEYGNTTAESVRHTTKKFLAITLVEPQGGNLLFDDVKEAIEQLGAFPAAVIERLYAEVVKVINADTSDKAVARAEKNSETTPSGSSPGTPASSSESRTLVSSGSSTS